MTHQWSSRHLGGQLGRAAALVLAGQALVLYGGPVAHADDGVLGDTGPVVEAPVVEAPVEQAAAQVTPVVTAPPPPPTEAAAEPTRQAVEAVRQVAEPVRRAPEPVRQAAEQVRQTTTTAAQTTQQTAQVVQPVRGVVSRPDGPVGTSEAERTSTVTATPQAGGGASSIVARGRPGPTASASRAERAGAARNGRADASRPESATRRTHPTDLASRAAEGRRLPDLEAGDPWEAHGSRDDLVTLTNSLMELYAGPAVPGGINSGLAGTAAGAVAVAVAMTLPWTVPALLGLLLGLWALVLARRCGTEAGPSSAPRQAWPRLGRQQTGNPRALGSLRP